MEILSQRLCPETGKRQILLHCPKAADDGQNVRLNDALTGLFRQYGLSAEHGNLENDDAPLYVDADTQLCWLAFCSGEWAGQIVQMEKDWLSFQDQARQMTVIREFKAEYYYLEKRLNRRSNGKFADKEVQRLFEFYQQAFELAAEYQGNAKETQWWDSDDFFA